MYAKNEITKVVEAALADAICILEIDSWPSQDMINQIEKYKQLLAAMQTQNLDVSLKSRDE